jgi:hypothetical protein
MEERFNKLQDAKTEEELAGGSRALQDINDEGYDMTAIIEQVDADTRKDVKVSEYPYYVPKNHSFISTEGSSSILIKMLLLFVRDTEIEVEKGKEQKYFYELDKEMWKLTVTTK